MVPYAAGSLLMGRMSLRWGGEVSEFRETQNAVMEPDASKNDVLPEIYELSTAGS